MSIPYHHDSALVPYNFLESAPITDVTTLIADFRAQVVTGLSWTEPSTALFTSPVDAAGRFMDVLLTRISAGNLEIRVRDQSGATVCTRRIQIDTAGTIIRYHCNIYGCVVSALRTSAASETFQAHVLDLTPDAQGDHALYVIGTGHRTNGDGVDGNGASFVYFAKDNGSMAASSRCRRYDEPVDQAGAALMISATGALVVKDVQVAINFATIWRWAGRICHAITVPHYLTSSTLVRANIDDNTQATFKVTEAGSVFAQTMAFRSAG